MLGSKGYDFFLSTGTHLRSALEARFARTIQLLHDTTRPDLLGFEECIISPKGADVAVDYSPYDFLLVYRGHVALVELDGPQHFFHITNQAAIQLNEARKARRMEIDRSKIEFCLSTGLSLLRIAYPDGYDFEDILIEFLDQMESAQNTVIMYSNHHFYGHLIPQEGTTVRYENICYYDILKREDKMSARYDSTELTIPEQSPMCVNTNVQRWMREEPVAQHVY